MNAEQDEKLQAMLRRWITEGRLGAMQVRGGWLIREDIGTFLRRDEEALAEWASTWGEGEPLQWPAWPDWVPGGSEPRR